MKCTHTLAICGAALALLASACHNAADDPILVSEDVMGFSATAPGDSLSEFTVYCYVDGKPYMHARVNRQQGSWTYGPACYWPAKGQIEVFANAPVTPGHFDRRYARATIAKRPVDNIVRLDFK